jgi:hypothetical protein
MPIPASINDLSTTAGSNSPAGSESPSLIDDYLRTYASYIAQLRDGSQGNAFNYAAAGGSANAITATYSPAVTALSDSTVLLVKAASFNTGATTFSPNGLTAKPIVGVGHAALAGGEIVANGDVCLQYNSSIGGGSWVLISSSGGTIPVPTAGLARNIRAYVATASASATFTADEVCVEVAMGSLGYKLTSLNKVINLATTGAGGMDTGTAPVSGFVGIYAIYNPGTATAALLAVNANAAVGHVYGGANMPSGYIASGLIAVLPTNASSQFLPVLLRDRRVSFSPRTAISTNTMAGTPTALSVSGSIPANAISVGGSFGLTSTATSNLSTTLSEDAVNALASAQFGLNGVTMVNPFELGVTAAQFIYYQCASSAGTPTYSINITSYRF